MRPAHRTPQIRKAAGETPQLHKEMLSLRAWLPLAAILLAFPKGSAPFWMAPAQPMLTTGRGVRVDGLDVAASGWRQRFAGPSGGYNARSLAGLAALRLYQPFTQVISDVDDTLKSSGGVNVAGVALGGIDVQYKRGQFYPGVFQFMLECSAHSLDRYAESGPAEEGGGEARPKLCPPKVAVLTARAEEFKAALELKDDSKLAVEFRAAGERAGFKGWGLGPVLYGSVAEWVVQDRKGMRKFSNFERLLEQDPTGTIMQYIYVGDTGELDQEAGETMLREYPEVVKAVFLHVVSDRPDPPIPPPKLINGRPVVFFRTYAGAAARACQLGLMDEDGMMRVCAAAEQQLVEMGVPRGTEKRAELERDIGMCYRTLSEES